MEFGENWLKPIHGRIHNKCPDISSENLDKLNSLCKKVNKFSNDYVCNNILMVNGEMSFVDFDKFKNDVLGKFDWISKSNLNHLYSQSCYYTLK